MNVHVFMRSFFTLYFFFKRKLPWGGGGGRQTGTRSRVEPAHNWLWGQFLTYALSMGFPSSFGKALSCLINKGLKFTEKASIKIYGSWHNSADLQKLK